MAEQRILIPQRNTLLYYYVPSQSPFGDSSPIGVSLSCVSLILHWNNEKNGHKKASPYRGGVTAGDGEVNKM